MSGVDQVAESLRQEYRGWRIQPHLDRDDRPYWTAVLVDERAGWYPTLVRLTIGALGEALADQRTMRAARAGE